MLNKAELVNRLASKLGKTKKETLEFVNAHWSVIEEALANGEEAQVVGYAKFEIRQTKARMARNPKTEERVHVPAGQRIVVVPKSKLRRAVKGN